MVAFVLITGLCAVMTEGLVRVRVAEFTRTSRNNKRIEP